jgi:hypothetical protein
MPVGTYPWRLHEASVDAAPIRLELCTTGHLGRCAVVHPSVHLAELRLCCPVGRRHSPRSLPSDEGTARTWCRPTPCLRPTHRASQLGLAVLPGTCRSSAPGTWSTAVIPVGPRRPCGRRNLPEHHLGAPDFPAPGPLLVPDGRHASECEATGQGLSSHPRGYPPHSREIPSFLRVFDSVTHRCMGGYPEGRSARRDRETRVPRAVRDRGVDVGRRPVVPEVRAPQPVGGRQRQGT